MLKNVFLMTVALFIGATSAMATEIGGVNLPDSLMAGKTQLLLNGAGLRKKFFMKIYAGALYLMQKSDDAEKIVAADAPMSLRMHFIYDGVSAEKLIGGWNDGFAQATGGNISPIKDGVAQFNSFFKEEAKKGDVYDFVYVPGEGVTVSMKGKQMGTIKGLAFKNALFGIWLGKKPADKGLKKGMLGK